MPELPLQRIGLVSQAPNIVDLGMLAEISAAISKQVARDLTRFWSVNAAVHAYPDLTAMPIGVWPVIVQQGIGNAAGFHRHSRNRQPYALVEATPDRDMLSLALSHECLEMLVNPYGDYLVEGDSPIEFLAPNAGQDRVQFLIEICDPSEAVPFAYRVDGVLVSDFYSFSYFDPNHAPGTRYSFTGAITRPIEVLQGGYLSWKDSLDEWYMLQWFAATAGPILERLGRLARPESIRTQIDRLTATRVTAAMAAGAASAQAALKIANQRQAQLQRAATLSAEIKRLASNSAFVSATRPVTTPWAVRPR